MKLPILRVTFDSSDGKPYVHFMSIGADDERHPGLPEVQSKKLKNALVAGIRLARCGMAGIAESSGNPRPHAIS
jgi:hypothetical protein